MEPEPLPRGRHSLSREEVLASQRERLTVAMLDLVAERGYAATTVPDVVAAARVSRNAFYALFADKEDCFLQSCDKQGEELLALMFSAPLDQGWIHALSVGMDNYLAYWARRPVWTQSYFVELPTVGAPAMEQRERQYGPFRDMFTALGALARHEQPDLPPLSAFIPRVLVVTITELIAEEVRAGRIDSLSSLRDDLISLCVRLLANDATASRL